MIVRIWIYETSASQISLPVSYIDDSEMCRFILAVLTGVKLQQLEV